MLDKGVIVRVDTPTDWCSPLVIVPKKDNSIRLCVDFTKLNESVKRELYPVSSVDYTLGQLDGAKVFSKLDANSADSSSYGIGVALLQLQEDGTKRPVAYASRSLTSAERNWAQIEKEALAIAWGCERFEHLILGLHLHIETDHKPLLSIFKIKDLDNITPRLQRIRLRLMRYTYDITYTPGKQLILADALSRDTENSEEEWELTEEILAYIQNIDTTLPSVSDEKLREINQETMKDETLKHVSQYCVKGWPEKSKIPEDVLPYWYHREDISEQNGILLFGSRIIIPNSLRANVLRSIHEGHQGITKCRSFAKLTVWWPRLSQQIKELVENCKICAENRATRAEPLIPTPYPDRPWQIVGADLLKCKGHWYLLISDYYSRFMEIARLNDLKMGTIVTYTKSIFARHGVPETVRADCGSQFDCCQFKQLGRDYGFKLITSSPKFPQSNGFIEAQVKNFKYHLEKSDDPYKMLLMLRATPLENGKSPAELLFGRRIRTYVPIMSDQLRPYLVDAEKLREKEEARIDCQKIYFDKRHRVKELPTLPDGAQVHIKDRNQGRTILNILHLDPI
ncbi:uncharacterized protein K02A2.6-like [Macrosteles quadrilineatus]|uniref:uncharacterized protein K02A2.6-like n=1 Tax=Macrosteles quadrilineatus TaxID=74068 RepID=UPI0023E26CD5|nr:uncharacterized protein K02A2.6-like [Macrosteles quadrilineatus]